MNLKYIWDSFLDAYLRLKTREKPTAQLPLESTVDAIHAGKRVELMLETSAWRDYMRKFVEYREILLANLSTQIKTGKLGSDEIAVMSAHIAGMTDAFSPIRLIMDEAENAKSVLTAANSSGEKNRIVDMLRMSG